MSGKGNNYYAALKATTLFGGIQVVQILVQLIRSKFLAVLIGPYGIGYLGLINNSLSLLEAFTGLGIATSAIKPISNAHTNNPVELGKIVWTVRRLILVTGLFGCICTALLSPLLSIWTFGDTTKTMVFLLVSISILFNQAYSGNISLLKGVRANKGIASVVLVGNILSLILTIPLYYLLGISGIVPGIILISLVNFCLSSWQVKRQDIPTRNAESGLFSRDARQIIFMGIMISLSSVMTLGSSYLLRIYINLEDGLSTVGLYNSGFALITTYVGLVFTAMSLDYFPRIAAVSDNNLIMYQIVNQQAEIAILILGPIICTFILLLNTVVVLLYSTAFLPVVPMLFWAAIGVLLRGVTWSIGYIFLAKSDNKVFFLSELLSNFYFLILSILGYKFLKLEGLGIAYLVGYTISLVQVYAIAKVRYSYSIDKRVVKVVIMHFLFVLVLMAVVYLMSGLVRYISGFVIIASSAVYSVYVISNTISFKEVILSIKTKVAK